MRDRSTAAVGLGWFDAGRMAPDCALVKSYFGIEQPFDATKAFTNEFPRCINQDDSAVAQVDRLCTQVETPPSAVPKG
jgi:hypothetical protein